MHFPAEIHPSCYPGECISNSRVQNIFPLHVVSSQLIAHQKSDYHGDTGVNLDFAFLCDTLFALYAYRQGFLQNDGGQVHCSSADPAAVVGEVC